MRAECLLLYYVSARMTRASFLRDLPAISRWGNKPEDTDRALFTGSFVPKRCAWRAYASCMETSLASSETINERINYRPSLAGFLLASFRSCRSSFLLVFSARGDLAADRDDLLNRPKAGVEGSFYRDRTDHPSPEVTCTLQGSLPCREVMGGLGARFA